MIVKKSSYSTLKSRAKHAGFSILCKDIEEAAQVEYDYAYGIPHVITNLIYLKDGRVFELEGRTHGPLGNYSLQSAKYTWTGVMRYSAPLTEEVKA